MSIDSSIAPKIIVPEIKITPPDGELLYISPYTGEMTNIDTRVYGQGELSYSGPVNDRAYPPTYDVREKATIDEYGAVQITHGYSRVDWDGVHDSSPGLVYDGSYPPTYNVRGGILYASDVKTDYIANPPDTSTEPSDLKNTKSNIRKIKPDINSDLKRV